MGDILKSSDDKGRFQGRDCHTGRERQRQLLRWEALSLRLNPDLPLSMDNENFLSSGDAEKIFRRVQRPQKKKDITRREQTLAAVRICTLHGETLCDQGCVYLFRHTAICSKPETSNTPERRSPPYTTRVCSGSRPDSYARPRSHH